MCTPSQPPGGAGDGWLLACFLPFSVNVVTTTSNACGRPRTHQPTLKPALARKRTQVLLGIFASAMLVGTCVPAFVSTESVRQELESVLTNAFETPIRIDELAFKVFPWPGLKAQTIRLAEPERNADLAIGVVHADLSLWQLLRGRIGIADLRIEELTGSLRELVIRAAKIAEPSADDGPVDVAVERIFASRVSLRSDAGDLLGPYALEARFTPDGDLKGLALSRADGTLHVALNARPGESARFVLSGAQWKLPVKPGFTFEHISAQGALEEDRFILSRVEARVLGGTLEGASTLAWNGDWILSGRMKADGINAEPVLALLDQRVGNGSLAWNGHFALRAANIGRLFEAPEVVGRFALSDGTLSMGSIRSGGAKDAASLPYKTISGNLKLTQGSLQVEQLNVAAPSVFSRSLGPYNVALTTDASDALKSLELREANGKLSIAIKPAKKGMSLRVDAKDWTSPVKPFVKLKKLALRGHLGHQHLRVSTVKASLYGGTVAGEGRLSWGKRWAADFDTRISSLQVEPLLAATKKRVLAGTVYATSNVRLTGSEARDLFAEPTVDGEFSLRHGAVYDVDLEKAATSLSGAFVTGGETRFDELSGKLNMSKGRISLRDLKVTSSVLEAEGELLVTRSRKLTGELDVGLASLATIVGIPILVSGTVDQPRLRPTNEAIAGAAAGTAVLGPVGAVIGIKAGQAVRKVFKFLKQRRPESWNRGNAEFYDPAETL